MKNKQYEEGEACNHKGCLQHVTHPCENCGRIQGMSKESYIDKLIDDHDLIEAEERKKWKTIIRPLVEKREAIAKTIAEIKSPVRIGEMISNGKETFIVDFISASYSFGFSLKGRKIKKDGTPGVQTREIYMYNPKTWHKVVKG